MQKKKKKNKVKHKALSHISVCDKHIYTRINFSNFKITFTSFKLAVAYIIHNDAKIQYEFHIWFNVILS
jgi:hypothetical protein